MDERLRKPICALLAVTLAANCAFPWYAWADDLSEVSNGYEDDRGTRTGNEPVEGSDERETNSESPEAAGAGAETLTEGEASREAGEQVFSGSDSFIGPSAAGSGAVLEQVADNLGDSLTTTELPLYSTALASGAGGGFVGGSGAGGAFSRGPSAIKNNWDAIKNYYTWFYDGSSAWQTNVSTSDKLTDTLIMTLIDLMMNQWGFNHGATSIYYSYSPGAKLSHLLDTANIIQSYLVAAGGDGVSYTAASWLKSAVVELRSIDDLMGKTRENTNLTQGYLASWLGHTSNTSSYKDWSINGDVWHTQKGGLAWLVSESIWFENEIRKNTALTSSYSERVGNFLKAKADDGVEYSAAAYLHTLAKDNAAMRNYLKSTASDGVEYSAAGFLNMIASRARELNSISSKGFADILLALSDLEINVDSNVDMSETNKLLGRLTADVASIRDKYVIDHTLNTLVNGLVGDLQLSAPAGVGKIQTAMSTAFPFCVPFIVNEVLFGSLVADAVAPVWNFDVAGAPLVVDFSDFDAFAEVSRWTVRLLFIAALLLNTKRFVYGLDEV